MNMNKIMVTIVVVMAFITVLIFRNNVKLTDEISCMKRNSCWYGFRNNVKLTDEISEQSELIVQQRLLITEYQKNCKNAIEHLKLEELDTVQGICGNTPQ